MTIWGLVVTLFGKSGWAAHFFVSGAYVGSLKSMEEFLGNATQALVSALAIMNSESNKCPRPLPNKQSNGLRMTSVF